MKNIFLFSIIMAFTSCMPKDLPTYVKIEPEMAEVKFSHQTTKSEMEKIAADLTVVGINLDYQKSTFFEDGKLRDLNIWVTCPDGNEGKTSAALTNLQFGYYGFRYDKSGPVGFQIGSR